MTVSHFPRTPEMNAKLGITSDVTYVDQATAKLEQQETTAAAEEKDKDGA